MAAHITVLRNSLLYLSQRKWLRHWMETSRLARPLTSRFIAGLTLDAEIAVCRKLTAKRMMTSLDHLGENVQSLEEARAARDAYVAALDRIAAEKLPSTVSMKVTSLGLDISEEACIANTEQLVQKAARIGSRIEFDMEDSSYTDRNLRILRLMHQRYGAVRAVIQAYLYRSEADIEQLCDEKVPIRLCKGAYKEPADVAFQAKSEVDSNYVKLMRILFERGTLPAIASHDEKIISEAIRLIREHSLKPDQFEFQMLYGVQRRLQQRIVDEGFRLRIYVPYGDAWYPYFMRRLAERPANVLFLARTLLQK